MIVVDASVLVNVFSDDGDVGQRAVEAVTRDEEWASVEHFRAEVFSGIRGRWLGRRISATRADGAIRDLAGVRPIVIDTSLLLTRMWALRDNLSGYDAAYVAAAEVLECPLVTADRRLAAAPGIRCEVRLAA